MKARPKVPRSREERHEALLNAAASLFHERGFWGVSIRDIAKRAGVAGSTVYDYAANKETLIYQVLHRSLKRALTSAEAAQSVSHAKHRLRALITDHIRRVMDDPSEAWLLQGAPLPLTPQQDRRIRDLREHYAEHVRSAVDAAVRKPGERKVTSVRRAQLLVAMADRVAKRAHGEHPQPRATRLADPVLSLFFHGVRGPTKK